ncbi:hypothetical protein KXD40_005374 [Peronospora effusa]|uniref:HTH La-type RNA-binding domain-containing protein n=1 Tax=Peronospora effusa TaxID=542832 RepID=A0A3M6VFI1_9STRA|nr:hypothetical protein DD238_005825 [Peronospora effusa]RQM14190.1 hypothetical protein DD237_006246 [Peronospora effusa]UIZ27496.1 hypothetical protein KXD40_005374 [Peronospora effusa]
MAVGGKSQRKRLQRQLEFYLSESNLRRDKFLQQAMDEQGFVPVHVLLSFNKLKMLKATERMILDEAEKSSAIRVDRPRSCIAAKVVPAGDQSDDADARTIYIDSFSATDDHDSLRRVFAKFGKVNLVSLPRFPQSKKFKGFGFVEFSDQHIADAVVSSSDVNLKGVRVMSKTRWLEMKEQLKRQLYRTDVAAGTANDKADAPDGSKSCELGDSAATITKTKKRRTPAAREHVHFGDDNINEEATKKHKV